MCGIQASKRRQCFTAWGSHCGRKWTEKGKCNCLFGSWAYTVTPLHAFPCFSEQTDSYSVIQSSYKAWVDAHTCMQFYPQNPETVLTSRPEQSFPSSPAIQSALDWKGGINCKTFLLFCERIASERAYSSADVETEAEAGTHFVTRPNWDPRPGERKNWHLKAWRSCSWDQTIYFLFIPIKSF